MSISQRLDIEGSRSPTSLRSIRVVDLLAEETGMVFFPGYSGYEEIPDAAGFACRDLVNHPPEALVPEVQPQAFIAAAPKLQMWVVLHAHIRVILVRIVAAWRFIWHGWFHARAEDE
jgi:hypothetical protein